MKYIILQATAGLIGALGRKGWSYAVDEGGGAFYGPKIDIKIQDAIGRRWQCSTIQCDFNLPERFDLEYTASDNTRQRPIMVHRAIFGSLERFFGVMIESTAGDIPLWLSPVQLRLLPVVDEVLPYCKELQKQAAELGIRVELDTSGSRLAKGIRTAEQEKIPNVGVIGIKERDQQELTVRIRKGGDLGTMSRELLFSSLKKAITDNVELHETEEMKSRLVFRAPAAAATEGEEGSE